PTTGRFEPSSWQPGCLRETRGFPSHPRRWFGLHDWSPVLRARAVPPCSATPAQPCHRMHKLLNRQCLVTESWVWPYAPRRKVDVASPEEGCPSSAHLDLRILSAEAGGNFYLCENNAVVSSVHYSSGGVALLSPGRSES